VNEANELIDDLPNIPTWVIDLAAEVTQTACDAIKNAVGTEIRQSLVKRLEIDVRGGMIRTFRRAYSNGSKDRGKLDALKQIGKLMIDHELTDEDLLPFMEGYSD